MAVEVVEKRCKGYETWYGIVEIRGRPAAPGARPATAGAETVLREKMRNSEMVVLGESPH